MNLYMILMHNYLADNHFTSIEQQARAAEYLPYREYNIVRTLMSQPSLIFQQRSLGSHVESRQKLQRIRAKVIWERPSSLASCLAWSAQKGHSPASAFIALRPGPHDSDDATLCSDLAQTPFVECRGCCTGLYLILQDALVVKRRVSIFLWLDAAPFPAIFTASDQVRWFSLAICNTVVPMTIMGV